MSIAWQVGYARFATDPTLQTSELCTMVTEKFEVDSAVQIVVLGSEYKFFELSVMHYWHHPLGAEVMLNWRLAVS